MCKEICTFQEPNLQIHQEEKRATKMELENSIRALEVRMDRLGAINTDRYNRELAEMLTLLKKYEKEYASL